MNKFIKVLGDGQIWDLKWILPDAPEEKFEDLFSGRALGEMASKNPAVFSRFKEKSKITGLSVTKALLSNELRAKNSAKFILKDLAKNGALGIEALIKGKGFKNNWSATKRNYWRNLDFVLIGGGVSEGLTGKFLVKAIKRYLSYDGLSGIKVYQAKFPGKEAGFLGAVVNIIKVICKEAEAKDLKLIAAMGLDLGRDEIGAGLVLIDVHSEKILRQRKNYWLFKDSVKVPYKNYLKKFLDARQDYSAAEFKLGRRMRRAILMRLANLIIKVQAKVRGLEFVCSQNIGVAVPGSTSKDGFILNSTDYLPLFRKQDKFNFAKSLENLLTRRNSLDVKVYIVNDGIAAGVANVYFETARIKNGKFAFLGVGSGLGGCVGIVGEK